MNPNHASFSESWMNLGRSPESPKRCRIPLVSRRKIHRQSRGRQEFPLPDWRLWRAKRADLKADSGRRPRSDLLPPHSKTGPCFGRHACNTRRCEAEFPVPISDAGACVPHTRTGTCSSGQDAARCTCIHTAVAPGIDPRYPEKNQPPGG